MTRKKSSEKLVRDIKRNTRRKYSSEEKIRIVIEGMRGETSIAEVCRREGIAQNCIPNFGQYIIKSKCDMTGYFFDCDCFLSE